MTVHISSYNTGYGERVVFKCDTREEYDSELEKHKATCVNPDDPRRLLDVNRYFEGVSEIGCHCGALSTNKQFGCDTLFLIKGS